MKELKINNDDCFCKIINPSEVHWAFIQPKKSNTGEYIIKFVDSKSNVFDEIKFPSWWSAKCDVKKNGFEYDFVYPHMGIEKPKKPKKQKKSNFLSKPLDKREVTCYNTRPQTQRANELLEKKC